MTTVFTVQGKYSYHWDRRLIENAIYRLMVKGLDDVEIERYEEQIIASERGNLRMRLRFADNSLLEISEAIQIKAEVFSWLSYRYHYQKPGGGIIFRYDNTPHHPEISKDPDHKHVGEEIIGFVRPDIGDILSEVKKYTG